MPDELDKALPPVLTKDALSLQLAPAAGGAVARFTAAGRPVLRQPSAAAAYADQLACFPLVPFSNRVRDGNFAWRGRTIHLPRNHFDPHPLHGDGWHARWRSIAAGPDEAVLAYEHDGSSGWPWRYRAEQRFRLGSRALVASLALRNLADEVFPAGLGFHPYFPRRGARLTTRLDAVWLGDATKIPTERVPVPRAWDFGQGCAVEGLAIDNCFTGWSGEAVIDWPYGRCVLTAAPPLDKLVIYVPPGQDFFCVEPVSNVTDGFNLRARGVADTGVHDLSPGDEFSVEMRLALEGSW